MNTGMVEEWTLDGALDSLARIHQQMPDRQFAFILGAGASFKSGIPTGKQLAQSWLKDLHARLCHDGTPLDGWLAAGSLNIPQLSLDKAAEHYSAIFECRFRNDPHEGYAALENAMEGKQPSLGYSLLAEIIQKTNHKVVITTNFDNLVADALTMHAHQSPLVVAHESLTGFIQPRLRRPLVAKIHRDLFYAPVNDHAGVSKMDDRWKDALSKLFRHFTPIVVGYGGNDGSLMGLLNGLAPDDIVGRMVWCYLDGSPPPPAAAEILFKHKGVKVKIPGFDDFMLRLAEKLVPDFDVAGIAQRTESLGKERADRYRKQAQELQESSQRGTEAQKQTGLALTRSVQQRKNWWAWELFAKAEADPIKRDAIYKQGLEQFPQSAELTGNYAIFLADQRKDYGRAQVLFKRALELDPSDAINTGNYANFLNTQRKDYDGAEALYKKALELDPSHASITGNYASLLATQRHDYHGAEALYKKGLALDPNDATITGNYAVFLASMRGDYDGAEALYKKALELDPSHAANTGNYASFLAARRGDYDGAEALYKKALELDPGNTNSMANLAALCLCKGDSISVQKVAALVQQIVGLSAARPSQGLAEALLYRSLQAEICGEPVAPWLARLKGLLELGYERGSWDFSPVFDAVLPQVASTRTGLYRALGAAILDAEQMAALAQFDDWRSVDAVDPFEEFDSPEASVVAS